MLHRVFCSNLCRNGVARQVAEKVAQCNKALRADIFPYRPSKQGIFIIWLTLFKDKRSFKHWKVCWLIEKFSLTRNDAATQHLHGLRAHAHSVVIRPGTSNIKDRHGVPISTLAVGRGKKCFNQPRTAACEPISQTLRKQTYKRVIYCTTFSNLC